MTSKVFLTMHTSYLNKPSSRKSSYEEPSYEDSPVLNFRDKGRGEYSSGDSLVLVYGNQLEGSGESRAPLQMPGKKWTKSL